MNFKVFMGLIIVFLLACLVIGTTPQVEAEYDIGLTGITAGESFVIEPLSPLSESVQITVTIDSENLFYIIGDNSEIVSEKNDDKHHFEGPIALGNWQVREGSGATILIHSDTALKVTAQRGFDYHLAGYAIAFVILILVLYIIVIAF